VFRFKTDRAARRLGRKMASRAKRSTRKLRSQDRVPFAGVWIGKRVVKNHRYLRDHGFNHSPSVANVDIDQKQSGLPTGRNLVGLAAIALLMGLI
jgi:hypothetical protein